jgi:hypothetical protein
MGLAPPELQRHYSVLNDDWEVDPVACRYQSPEPSAERPEQTLMFGHTIANGSFWADITPQKASRTQRDTFSMEAALIFRYTHPEAFYYAGISAFDTKFFAAKVLPGPYFQPRGYVGRRSSVLAGKTYHIRVDFNGGQITVYENEVQQFTVLDDAYVRGQLGLRTWRTQALFENVHITPAQPRCFVVMPFASELAFVYRTIKEVIEEYGIACERADEVYLSSPVMDDVKQRISEADLVLVDFTGRNPNVYYEAGLADAFKKDWIVLAQTSDDMTFDVRHIRSIRYSNTMGADIRLRDDLHQALRGLGYKLPPATR